MACLQKRQRLISKQNAWPLPSCTTSINHILRNRRRWSSICHNFRSVYHWTVFAVRRRAIKTLCGTFATLSSTMVSDGQASATAIPNENCHNVYVSLAVSSFAVGRRNQFFFGMMFGGIFVCRQLRRQRTHTTDLIVLNMCLTYICADFDEPLNLFMLHTCSWIIRFSLSLCGSISSAQSNSTRFSDAKIATA